MMPQKRMTSKIGKISRRIAVQLSKPKGFTFIEVMVAVAILTLGVTMILRSYIISMDRMTYLTNRLYALNHLEDRTAVIERKLRALKTLPIDMSHFYSIGATNDIFEATENVEFSSVEDFVEVFELDLSISWQEHGLKKQLLRTAYIADFPKE